jgi:predicted CopG family antitoxin
MASRTVALDEEAYDLLKRSKKDAESFSDAVKRLARPRRPISSFGGMWGDMSGKEQSALERLYADLQEADRRRAGRIRRMRG